MLIVTGGIACGKSTLLEVARKMGYNCVDADEWFHDIFIKDKSFAGIMWHYFGEKKLKDVAFIHKNWSLFQAVVDYSFAMWIQSETMQTKSKPFDIVVIPDYFKRSISMGTEGVKVLTIERPYNLKAATERDAHRSNELTVMIHQHQMDPGKRREKADHVLENEKTKEEFEKECEKWLKLHLQVASTLRTKVIATS